MLDGVYDLVIRGGQVVDGLGGEPMQVDIGITGGWIAAVGPDLAPGREEIDAVGRLVLPGFVDIHTHYDGQVTWEHRMAPSSAHGVTTVVMGNCGVGFAPCHADRQNLLVRLMEGVEDIPEPVMVAGVPWTWETFPEYLDTLAARAFDVDVAAQIPHSPMRVYVMGERGADREPATEADLAEMTRLVAEAIRAGALGVTSSRSLTHREKSGKIAPSVSAADEEVLALAEGLRQAGAGVFQLIPSLDLPAEEEFDLFRRVVSRAGRPLSFTLLQMPGNETAWRDYLALLDEAAGEGLEIRGQVTPRPPGMLYGLDLSYTPFTLNPSWREVADLPLPAKVEKLRDPAFRERLLAERAVSENSHLVKQLGRTELLYELEEPLSYEPAAGERIGAQARAQGVAPAELIYDRLLGKEGRAIFFIPSANFVDETLDATREMMAHDNTVIALGDGGAHYGMVCDASYTTYFLVRWVRDAPASTAFSIGEAAKMLCSDPAASVGLGDRGVVRPGYKADLNIIDLERLTLHAPHPIYDLPAGGRRLIQEADGYAATIVSGVVTYREGAPTGALPGALVRGGKSPRGAAAAPGT